MVYPTQNIAKFIELTRRNNISFTVAVHISKLSPCFSGLSEKLDLIFQDLSPVIKHGKKTRCSCLLQTFNSSKYGFLTPVLSHARLNKITKSGLLIPFLLVSLRYQHAHTPTYTHPFIHNSLSKILSLPSRY